MPQSHTPAGSVSKLSSKGAPPAPDSLRQGPGGGGERITKWVNQNLPLSLSSPPDTRPTPAQLRVHSGRTTQHFLSHRICKRPLHIVPGVLPLARDSPKPGHSLTQHAGYGGTQAWGDPSGCPAPETPTLRTPPFWLGGRLVPHPRASRGSGSGAGPAVSHQPDTSRREALGATFGAPGHADGHGLVGPSTATALPWGCPCHPRTSRDLRRGRAHAGAAHVARGKAALRTQRRPRQLGSKSSRLQVPQVDSQAPFFPSAHGHQTVSGGPNAAQSLWPRPRTPSREQRPLWTSEGWPVLSRVGRPHGWEPVPTLPLRARRPPGPQWTSPSGIGGTCQSHRAWQVWVRQFSEHRGQGGSVPENCGQGRPAAGEGWDGSAQENWPLQTKGHGHMGCPAGAGPPS